MSDLHTAFSDLANEIQIQDDGTISKTLCQDSHLKVVLFGFDTGQELSEHTASVPAIMHFIDGEAEVTVGDERSVASANSFYRMDANVPHSITATKPTKMLLLLLKAAKPTD
ncbi:cupin domain-containing protein [Crateriforma conspicua]|uniref:Cupin domain protein n=1 Tax=Crateriforma conspicua TaxID=2527996 RepID=A0A5C6FQ13_9PLAN|nr:cupin domain-containing protein [Crateriforma conspicua]QDV61893.1 Cupin domain protein [Crateriforma conspicua]TWU62728.1 Cupin domain protein [Crateriforma conspicua]